MQSHHHITEDTVSVTHQCKPVVHYGGNVQHTRSQLRSEID